MKFNFDGLTAFQSEDNDILVTANHRPVVHIHCKERLSKKALEQNVRDMIAVVTAEQKARGIPPRLYDAVCPVCGKLNKNIYLAETGGQMECDQCGTVVDLNPMLDGHAIPALTKAVCVKIVGAVSC